MEQTKRIRLNQEYRNKIAKRIELGLDQENTIEKEKYLQLREQIKPLQDKTWALMYSIGRENYPQEDVDMAWHLQKKYENVNTIAPDSCFHVAYMDTRKEDKLNYNGDVVEAKGQPMEVEEHFDFKVDGSVESGSNSRSSGNKFAYAYFRDELKAQPECNPDINILMKDKDSNNPYQSSQSDYAVAKLASSETNLSQLLRDKINEAESLVSIPNLEYNSPSPSNPSTPSRYISIS